jgi:hypothetical protein
LSRLNEIDTLASRRRSFPVSQEGIAAKGRPEEIGATLAFFPFITSIDDVREKLAQKVRWPMEFRWLALIALWTMIAGPIFAGPGPRPKSGTRPALVHTQSASAPAKIVKP